MRAVLLYRWKSGSLLWTYMWHAGTAAHGMQACSTAAHGMQAQQRMACRSHPHPHSYSSAWHAGIAEHGMQA